jgi:large conductance mechanosensitive channel
MWDEFKEFAVRGNMVDMAVGIVVGGAFGKIVTSLVNDVVMPPIGLLLGKVDFSNLYVNLSGGQYGSLAEAQQAGALTLTYGQFLTAVLDFLIVSAVMFLLVKQINRLRRQKEAPTKTTQNCPHCTSTIPIEATRCPECTSKLKSS